MKFSLTIDGNATELELVQGEDGWRFCVGEGAEAVAQAELCEPGVYSILWNQRSYEARVEQGVGCLIVAIDGLRFEIEVRDPRRWTRRAAGAGVNGRHSLLSSMPGKVVRVLAAKGDAVEPGQGIVVVEAMKMQNEMKAAKAGTLIDLRVKEGDTVSAGEVLATIE